MNNLLDRVLDQFIGRGYWDALPTQDRLQDPGDSAAPVLVSLDPSKNMTHDLARQAYTHTHRFIVLPSRNAARWLLPAGDGRRTLEGLQIYTPYALGARILKALFGAVMVTGWQRWARQRVLIASREPLPIEILVREVAGEPQPVFALSLGTPTRFRKLAVQVMRPNGEILGYIKLPLTEAAAERVRAEAGVLERLWNFGALRPHIPKVLYAGDWEDGYILFQSRGPSCPGPVEFGTLQEEFLRTLGSFHQVEKPGHALVREVAARWRKAESLLDSRLRSLGEDVLTRASQELDGIMVPCGIMHGDFAPWNTRVENGHLYVFDWESAAWDAPVSWDIFHFHVQVASLLNKKRRRDLPLGHIPGGGACFLLYLLSSLSQLLEEKVSGHHAGVDYRRQLLTNYLYH